MFNLTQEKLFKEYQNNKNQYFKEIVEKNMVKKYNRLLM
jgi:hypothetical protein